MTASAIPVRAKSDTLQNDDCRAVPAACPNGKRPLPKVKVRGPAQPSIVTPSSEARFKAGVEEDVT
jgi:hypothetical protein